MRRTAFFILVLFLTISLGALTGCGGGGNTTVFGNPAVVTVTPDATSLDLGDVVNIGAVVTDSKNNTLYNSHTSGASSTVTFATSNSSILQIANNGLMCAGAWDSLTTPVVCTPASTVGSATVTATSGGITSAPVTVFVHRKVDQLTIAPLADCVSQGGTVQLSAAAFSGGQDITATVGPPTWTTSIADVVTISTSGLATAVNPGRVNLVASVGSFRSTPIAFNTCAVSKIVAHVKDAADTAFALDRAATRTVTADAFDTKGQKVVISKAASTGTATFTWTTTTPATGTLAPQTPLTSAVTSTTTNDAIFTAANAGTASIVASCTPPTCNVGLTPVYSNVVTATTNGATTTTVLVTGTDTTKLVPIATSANTLGTAVTLPQTPNSLLYGPDGARAFLGSAGGLMVVDPTTGALQANFTSFPGTVLTVAPDGKTAVIATATTVTLFDVTAATGTAQTFPVAGATAAAYSNDGYRLFIIGGGSLTTLTPQATRTTIAMGGTDVTFLGSGSLAYVAAGSLPVLATCDASQLTPVATTADTLVSRLQNGTKILAAGPNKLDVITAATDNAGCPPAVTNTLSALALTGTPRQIIATPDSSRAFITSDAATLNLYDSASNATSTIPLVNATQSFTGGVTLDSKQLYVGALGATPAQNAVHRIDLTNNTDAQQITGLDFTPNLVAVRPQ